MSRTIDLEGIATDGMGYTIRIAGPTKREQAELRVKQNMAKAGLITMGDSRKKTHDLEKQVPQKNNNNFALREIEAKTEVDVRESFHSSSYGARAWGFTPAERQQHEGLSPFHADDLDFETSALTPTEGTERPWSYESPTSATFSNRQRDLSKNPTFFESIESLEALPTMPSPPEYSHGAGSSRPVAASVFAKGLNKKRSAG